MLATAGFPGKKVLVRGEGKPRLGTITETMFGVWTVQVEGTSETICVSPEDCTPVPAEKPENNKGGQ